MEDKNILKRTGEPFQIQAKEVLHSSSILPGTIKDNHISGNILHTGLSTGLPDGSTFVKMYYETDTKKLKIWNSVALVWDEVQFA